MPSRSILVSFTSAVAARPRPAASGGFDASAAASGLDAAASAFFSSAAFSSSLSGANGDG